MLAIIGNTEYGKYCEKDTFLFFDILKKRNLRIAKLSLEQVYYKFVEAIAIQTNPVRN